MPAIIQVRDVRRSFRSPKKGEGFKGAMNLLLKPEYATHEALKGVSFEIEAGSFVGLIGANGAGKTTLLKILSGLIPPTGGSATVLGETPFKRTMDFRRQISLVMGQKAQLWWDLPARDAFDLLQAIYAIPDATYRERLASLAKILDVERMLQTQIRRLSLGERMKMELIGALIHWPKIIYLDEPTIGLDVLAAQHLREFLREFNRREKATIILTSHNMDDIERLCSRVMILRDGEMIFDGTPRGLTREGEIQLRVRLKETPSVDDLAAAADLPATGIAAGNGDHEEPAAGKEADDEDGADGTAGTYVFTLQKEQIVPTLQKLMSRFALLEMGLEEQSLESVIKRLYEEDRVLRAKSLASAAAAEPRA